MIPGSNPSLNISISEISARSKDELANIGEENIEPPFFLHSPLTNTRYGGFVRCIRVYSRDLTLTYTVSCVKIIKYMATHLDVWVSGLNRFLQIGKILGQEIEKVKMSRACARQSLRFNVTVIETYRYSPSFANNNAVARLRRLYLNKKRYIIQEAYPIPFKDPTPVITHTFPFNRVPLGDCASCD